MKTLTTTGQTISIAALNTGDTQNTYAIYNLFVMGETNDMVTVTINGVIMDLPAGFIFNLSPITSVTLNKVMVMKSDGTGAFVSKTGSTTGTVSSNAGICVIGDKTQVSLFGN